MIKRKPLLVGAFIAATLILVSFAAIHYLEINSVSNATGVNIPFNSSVNTKRNGGMMGGTIETWVEVPSFSKVLDQCKSDGSYIQGIIDYKEYRVLTTRFEERGMGKSLGCIKKVESKNSTKLIAIDNGLIFISEQWL